MRDYAQYSSRIPSPRYKSPSNVNSTPPPPKTATVTRGYALADKRERESVSTASSSGASRQPSPLHASNNRSSAPLNASDALALREHGPEATIVKLRQALDESQSKDSTAKSSLAKSDAVILELRSSIRQLKRQVETVDRKNSQHQNSQRSRTESQVEELQRRIQELQNQLAVSQTSSNDANVGELQLQLDRAHAQILTADMVRKELEDTLEAEQYTWELRVQDQERQVAELQHQVDTLTRDLQDSRSQWKEAEEGWNSQLNQMQQQLTQARTRMATSHALKNGSHEELVEKIAQLEGERTELQNCLDEALKELEAVDTEMQMKNGRKANASGNDKEIVESLQRLLTWILQESNSHSNLHNMPRQPKGLLDRIQKALESWMRETENSKTQGKNVRDLQQQISVYEQELKSREKSSVELRESLKEAVGLLKPLQDAVARAEKQKKDLEEKLRNSPGNGFAAESQMRQKNFKINELEDQVISLKGQVEEQSRLAVARESLLQMANSPASTPRNHDDSLNKIQKARGELRRKRESEGNLQQLLRDAQTRFHSLHEQNEKVVASNRELQGKLKSAEQRLSTGGEISLEEKLERMQHILAQRDAQVQQLQLYLENANSSSGNGSSEQFQNLSRQLTNTRNELAQKEQAEIVLNKSLKEALGLLKPLQMHLEDAEKEKVEISKELRNLRKRFRQLQMGEIDDMSKSTMNGDISVELVKMKEELEETVRQLELENSQLHDALDDVSEFDGADQSKIRQRMVEMNSRYEVSQNKLEDAHVENHSLVKALKQKELDEKQRKEETRMLYEKLAASESELNEAKSLVEQFTAPNVGKMRRGNPTQRQMV